jgi:hypothetical protein
LQHAVFELALRRQLFGYVEPDHDKKERRRQPGKTGGEAPVIFPALALRIAAGLG